MKTCLYTWRAVVMTTLALVLASIASAQTMIKAEGIIESTTGGFKFPDASVQVTAVTASPASAGLADGSHHRFVSTKGNDTNPCTITLPCRSFAAGVAAASDSGKVVAMDSGDYGPFTVDKTLTIEAAPGVHAGIAVFTGAGVTVNASQPESVIILRGLAIHNSGGEDGVKIFSGQTHIEKCSITGFKSGDGDGGQAIHTMKEALIEDSILIDNNIALWVDGESSLAWVNRTRVETNTVGVYVTCGARAITRDSVISNNFDGVLTGCRAPNVLVKDTLFARNFTGITSLDSSVIRVTGSSVIYNSIGLKQVGDLSSLLSRGDNTIEENDTNTVGVIGGYSPQ